MRSSDTAVRSEAQSLLNSMTESTSRSTAAAPRVSSAMIAETPENHLPHHLRRWRLSRPRTQGRKHYQQFGALPAVDDLVSRYVEALGGASALKKVTSHVIKGTVDVAGISRGRGFRNAYRGAK